MTIVAAIAFLLWRTQSEASSVVRLKSDLLKLQTEFNKINPKWTYHEYCRDKGGVYTSDEPSSCTIKIINNLIPKESLRSFDAYKSKLQEYPQFRLDGESRTYKIISSDNQPTDNIAVTFKPTYIENASCELISSLGPNKVIAATCSFPSQKFYFDHEDWYN